MFGTRAKTVIDPLAAFTAGAFTPDRRPVPLTDTRFRVEILGGIAVVETVRTFRNVEDISIEAVITFPVPVHAALFRLEAALDGRRLTAKARARAKAREVYEEAVDAGRAAVLHEEVLKGVHTLSVAHIAPGAEIEISTTWAASLTCVGSDGHLRIPLTVGDIYGRSGLNDVDDLISGAPASMGRLSITSSSGSLAVAGIDLSNGEAIIPLNAPIDVTVRNWEPSIIAGLAGDGRTVQLSVAPHEYARSDLNVAILVDHSGSMATAVDALAETSISQHRAVVEALSAYTPGANDRFDLWQFNDDPTQIGTTERNGERPRTLGQLVAGLAEPTGGTDIGIAVNVALLASSASDILLITDGKSFRLDAHRLAAMGRRISVLLVGEDSLDAKVGHLAALSGGDIWVSAGAEIGSYLTSALDALRSPAEQSDLSSSELQKISLVRSGVRITATWATDAQETVAELPHPAVAPFAANVALSLLDEDAASTLAETEGLVTHLTSLVLVDEASVLQGNIPALRKVALPQPREALWASRPAPASQHFSPLSDTIDCFIDSARSLSANSSARIMNSEATVSEDIFLSSPRGWDEKRLATSEITDEPSIEKLLRITMAIDWDQRANELLLGDLSSISGADAADLALVECDPAFVLLADRLAIKPLLLLIAVVASLADGSRNAQRVAKKLATEAQISEALDLLIAL